MAAKEDVQTPLGMTLGKIQPGRVSASHLASNAMTTAKIADDAVTKAKLAGSFLGKAVVAGGAAGNFTMTGIATTDQLVLVLHLAGAGTAVTDIADLTSEFTISAANTINNTGGTASSGGKLLVLYLDLT